MKTEEEVRARIAELENECKTVKAGSWTRNRDRVRVNELKFVLGEEKKAKPKKEAKKE
jgi:hypothetical protein